MVASSNKNHYHLGMKTALIPTVAFAAGAVMLLGMNSAQAADFSAKLVIRDHKFEPAELTVPANQKIQLLVDNQDATPEEFESSELNREKVVVGKSSITIVLGPLEAGKYPFFGDFHQETAQGVLIAK